MSDDDALRTMRAPDARPAVRPDAELVGRVGRLAERARRTEAPAAEGPAAAPPAVRGTADRLAAPRPARAPPRTAVGQRLTIERAAPVVVAPAERPRVVEPTPPAWLRPAAPPPPPPRPRDGGAPPVPTPTPTRDRVMERVRQAVTESVSVPHLRRRLARRGPAISRTLSAMRERLQRTPGLGNVAGIFVGIARSLERMVRESGQAVESLGRADVLLATLGEAVPLLALAMFSPAAAAHARLVRIALDPGASNEWQVLRAIGADLEAAVAAAEDGRQMDASARIVMATVRVEEALAAIGGSLRAARSAPAAANALARDAQRLRRALHDAWRRVVPEVARMTPAERAAWLRRRDASANPAIRRALGQAPPALDPARTRRMRAAIRRYRRNARIPRVDEPDTQGVPVRGGTVAVAETDIPALDGRTIGGASPTAVPPELRGRPGTTGGDVFRPANPVAVDHAEHVALENMRRAIDRGLADGSITRADLRGRTVFVLCEQEPCSSCVSGVGAGRPGVIQQFAARYPELTVEVRSLRTSRAYHYSGGRLLNP